MGKDTDNRLKEKEKLDAEIARSLSVVKVKEAHKQIEDVEKARKKSAITSIRMRLDSNMMMAKGVMDGVSEGQKINPKISLKKVIIKSGDGTNEMINMIISTFESIRFDLEENINVNKQDFDILFPKISLNFDTYDSIIPNLTCLSIHMNDLKHYCLRLL